MIKMYKNAINKWIIKDDFSENLIFLLLKTHSINSRDLAEIEFSNKICLKKVTNIIEIFN